MDFSQGPFEGQAVVSAIVARYGPVSRGGGPLDGPTEDLRVTNPPFFLADRDYYSFW